MKRAFAAFGNPRARGAGQLSVVSMHNNEGTAALAFRPLASGLAPGAAPGIVQRPCL